MKRKMFVLLALLLAIVISLPLFTACNLNEEALSDLQQSLNDYPSSDDPADDPVTTDVLIEKPATEDPSSIDESGSYTTAEDVALYIRTYGKLPNNFITKEEARELGWEGGGLEPYAPGMCIGGDRFGNFEGLLPEAEGRYYTECDIDTLGVSSRGAKRIVFSNDGLIYYTEDHYESFALLYGGNQ